MKLCLIMCALVVGGKFLGVGLDSVISFFKSKPVVQPTPIVQDAPKIEIPKEIPTEVIKYIDELLESQKENK